MKSPIQFYITVLLRRIHWVLFIALLFTAVSVTVARNLPAIYVSQAFLLVEPPQIPTNLAASTVQSNAQQDLQIIHQRLMTRVNRIDRARTENGFPDIAEMTPD